MSGEMVYEVFMVSAELYQVNYITCLKLEYQSNKWAST